MLKVIPLSFLLLFIFSQHSLSQCLSALPPPDCNGTEPLVTDGETINGGTTKWYYGATATFATLTLNGGTLVVCGDLTVSNFFMTTGTIYIRQGGRIVLGGGSGLQFFGGCAIYNYGTCEIQRNLTLEDPASAATPNIVINALSTSVFRMPNQYLVIANAYSSFVNNGTAVFWGIITDTKSTPGSVCLGNQSTTQMAILINKVANTYSAPGGNACVYVYQYSEFTGGQLTSDPTLSACLSSGHTSSTCGACTPNNWGAAQVFTNCSGCAAIVALPAWFASFAAGPVANGKVKLQWQMTTDIHDGMFRILRSADAANYSAIDSMPADANQFTSFYSIDKSPLRGNNYYMISYTNPQTGRMINSKATKVFSDMTVGFNLYPVPFDDKFFITYEAGTHPEKILLTDISGRNIPARYIMQEGSQSVEVQLMNKILPGLYIVHMQTNKTTIAKTIIKR
jgi:hypothetical protein